MHPWFVANPISFRVYLACAWICDRRLRLGFNPISSSRTFVTSVSPMLWLTSTIGIYWSYCNPTMNYWSVMCA